jgi:hypothetical protein
MWVTNPPLEQQIADQVSGTGTDPVTGLPFMGGHLIDFDQWSQPERDILAKQVNALGMKLANAGVLTDDSYQAISRWVGMYWYGKGTRSFIDFINCGILVNESWLRVFDVVFYIRHVLCLN